MASAAQLSHANTRFSMALFQQLNKDNRTGNIFCSPLSISSALAMVLLGARGQTATQMSESMCFSSDSDIHVVFNKLISELNKPGTPYALSLANRLFGDQSFQFVEDYLEKTRTLYKAELEAVDFQNKAEEARNTINTWVEKQTQDKVKELLQPGAVDSQTRLVLANAICFKGTWENQFLERHTYDCPFRMNKNESKQVKMMFQVDDFPLGRIKSLNSQVLEMPYRGNQLSMLIILPDQMEDPTTGLEMIEREMTAEKFIEWTSPDAMKNVNVVVNLPRFKLEETYNMSKVLASMGMEDVFNPTVCDLSGISPGGNLVVSEVVHRSFVEVNEVGTEAAAATAMMLCSCCGVMQPSFTADHPFLFFIRHNHSKNIIFAGRYSSPE